MTWIYVLLVVAALGGVLAWASRRQRRHSGDYTMEQAKRDAERHPGGSGSGGGFG